MDEDDDRKVEWRHWTLYGQDAFDRARDVRTVKFGELFLDVMAIGIEDPRGKNAGAIYRIQGAILARILTPALVQPWIPSQWRKAVGLKGNCPKSDVMAFVAKQHQPEWMQLVPGTVWASSSTLLDWPQDACDAYCIALATRAALETQAT